MLNLRQLFANLTFLSAFFPSTLYFIFPGNQVQPLYLLGAVPLLAFGITKDQISRPIFLIIALILISSLFSAMLSSVEINVIMLNGLSYMAPLIGFLSLYRNIELISVHAFKLVIIVWCMVGSVQYFDILYPFKPTIELLGKFTIADRFEAFRVVGGADGRGVSFLMAEPAGSALIIISMLASLRYFKNCTKITNKEFIVYSLICVFMTYLNASGTMLVLFILFVLGLFFNMRIGVGFILSSAFFGIATILLAFALNFTLDMENRTFMILKLSIDYLLDVDRLVSINDFIVSIVGLRYFNTIYSYGSIFHNFGLGNGIAGWSDWQTREEIMHMLDFDSRLAGNPYIDVSGEMKPWSYFSILIFDCGIFGLGLIAYFLVSFFRFVGKHKEWCYLLPMLVILFIFPPVTLLSPWLLGIYAMKANRARDD